MANVITKQIPNAITCCNLISGCVATYLAFNFELRWAFIAIIIGAVFDFLDGLTARALGVSSPIGKELDSLADVITFGFAPSAILFSILKVYILELSDYHLHLLPFLAFLIAAFSALRLAKFNLDTRQSMGFIGLPTPANALFWGSLGWVINAESSNSFSFANTEALSVLIPLLVGILVSCWLLISEIPMFALKFKTFAFRPNALRYCFSFFSLIMLCFLGIGTFIVIIPLYVLLSIVSQRYFK